MRFVIGLLAVGLVYVGWNWSVFAAAPEGGVELLGGEAPGGRHEERGGIDVGHAIHDQPVKRSVLAVVDPEHERLAELVVDRQPETTTVMVSWER